MSFLLKISLWAHNTSIALHYTALGLMLGAEGEASTSLMPPIEVTTMNVLPGCILKGRMYTVPDL